MGEAVAEAKAAVDAKADVAAGDSKKAEEAKVEDKEPELTDAVKKLIQSAEDKVRTKYSKTQKDLEAALETVKKEKMSAEEKVKYDEGKAREALEVERRQVQQAKLELYTIRQLSANELGEELTPYVLADSEEAVNERIKGLKGYLAKPRKLVAEEILKGNGRVIQQTPMGGQQLFTMDQLKAMTQSQVDALMATPEGERKIRESYAAGAKR